MHALQARLGLTLPPSTFLEAISHTSYDDGKFVQAQAELRRLGEDGVKEIVTEHFVKKWPNMPQKHLESIISAYIGPVAMISVGKNLGVHHVVRMSGKDATMDLVTLGCTHALLGSIHKTMGKEALKSFVSGRITSRALNLEPHLQFDSPRLALKQVLRDTRKPKMEIRLLRETGRATHSPTFVVGVYSGAEKLGEGYGTSIRMAETRVCKIDNDIDTLGM
jgi:dsRNA-specific ribonuclease